MTQAGAVLIVVADDLGLHPAYDAGILEAAAGGAIDAAGAMVLRTPRAEDVTALDRLGVEVGLHLESPGPTSPLDRSAILRQLEQFERLAGRRPDYLDGHHHCHAGDAVAGEVAAIAASLDLPVRSVSGAHRDLLRAAGVKTPDLLVGRLEEGEPVLPAQLRSAPPDARAIEWMVHPGHPAPDSGSGYDRGRGEDLRELLAFSPPPGMRRGNHRDLT